jgi:hypothetical protein
MAGCAQEAVRRASRQAACIILQSAIGANTRKEDAVFLGSVRGEVVNGSGYAIMVQVFRYDERRNQGNYCEHPAATGRDSRKK